MTKTDWTAEEVRAIGAWCQENSSGTYRNSAIAAHMLAHLAERIEAEESAAIGEVRENGVTWFRNNPNAFPIGTRFFTHPPAQPVQEQPGWKVCTCFPYQRDYCVDRDHCCKLTMFAASPTPPKEK